MRPSLWSILVFGAPLLGCDQVLGLEDLKDRPGEPTPLPTAGWVASAFTSLSMHDPSLAIDGAPTTRWTSGIPQAADQWFEVDMRQPHTFREIAVDAGNATDYMRGYQIFASMDGTTWGTFISSGTGAAQVVTADFAPVSARYIRIVLTANVPTTRWWSIAELSVLD
jgi:hypothetical protein